MSRIWRDGVTRARARAAVFGVCLAALAVSAAFATAAELEPLAWGLTPVLSVRGEAVQWTPVGGEASYRIAISSAPRGAAGRATHYLTILRTPGEAQSYTPTLQPEQTVYIGVSGDGGLTWSTEEATVTAPPPIPVLSVSGQTAQWTAPGNEVSYRIAISSAPRGSSGRATQYLTIPRAPGEAQSYTPTLQPEQTVYIGVSGDGGLTWSTEEATVTAPPPIPLLSVKGTTIYWTAVPGVTRYTLATILNPTTTRNTTYTTVTGTSYTPPAAPGQTVDYGLSASVPGEAPWAQEVTIAYPSVSPPPPPPTTTGPILGTNDGAGWGEASATKIVTGHITWNRVEIGASSNTILRSLIDGFKVLAVAGNVADGTPLSQIDPGRWASEVVSEIQVNPGIAIAEAGNEMYYKGGVANPVQYGRMYLAAVGAMKAAGIHTRLLFDMWGDYPRGSWASPSGWSQDAGGGGWLRDAVNGVPGLAAAILANGLSTHPYGALGENYADESGVDAVAAQEAIAQTELGSVPPLYITEFGYDMSRCGATDGACSELDQASKMHDAYEAFLADRHVAGIWWYQSHDDGTGRFGFMNNDGTTRLSFNVLSSIAAAQGQ
jgi:hypothetical protein